MGILTESRKKINEISIVRVLKFYISRICKRVKIALYSPKYKEIAKKFESENKDRVIFEWPNYRKDKLFRELRELEKNYNFKLTEYSGSRESYLKYLKEARYPPGIYPGNFTEKTLEHFISFKLLELNRDDIYVDIANGRSPFPEIVGKIVNCIVYKQDMVYDTDFEKHLLGGSAKHIPVRDDFFTKVTLHCSFEHFEDNVDIEFIKELKRVLKPGGRCCIIPFYLHSEYFILTDPSYDNLYNIPFDMKAKIFYWEGWYNRHGRYYNAESLEERILKNSKGLRLNLIKFTNPRDFDKSCYLNFILMVEKER